MRAFKLAVALVLLSVAAYSETSAFRFFGKDYVVEFDQGWQTLPGGLKGSSDCVFSSKRTGELVYLRGVVGLTDKKARFEIEGERTQAMVGPKEPVQEILWVGQKKALLWKSKDAAVVYFPVRDHWFRGFIRRKVGELKEPLSILESLKTIEEKSGKKVQ